VVRPKRILRRKHHPRADVVKVLDYLKGRSQTWEGGRLYVLASIYAYTGIRKSEALMLRVEDVDLKRGFLFVLPNGQELKTEGSSAPVPCPRALVAILRGWIGRCGSEWLIPNKGRLKPWKGGRDGKRPTDRMVSAGEAVGVEGFTPLSLRHSLATHFASFWGLSDKQIQMILRHTTVLTQRIYIHPDLINLGELVRDFDFAATPPRVGRKARADSPHSILRGRKRRRPAIDRAERSAEG
jgi:integrase